MQKSFFFLGVVFLGSLGCKKEFKPKVVSTNFNYLVVEGVLTDSEDSTIFKLSRTITIGGKAKSTAETGAIVTIEANLGGVYTLFEANNGRYYSTYIKVFEDQQYKLKIKTKDGKEYESDFVEVKTSPPIDTVAYDINAANLSIYVNTHDPANNTRYYRWEYEETWQFHANYQSVYIAIDSLIRPRNSDEQIYSCFGSDVSSHILIASSSKLKQDVIFKNPVVSIPSTSEKIETKYSILIKQYALTKDAFQFWQNMEKNTEQLGSIFDVQPSQIKGNIHCVSNPSEPVIGYFSAGNISQKRIFISTNQLPAWAAQSPYICEEYQALIYNPKTGQNDVNDNLIHSSDVITGAIYGGGNIIGYKYSTNECTNCTIRGTKQPPLFWK